LDHLALVPDLLAHIARPGRTDHDAHGEKLIVHHLEAVADVLLKIELSWNFKGFIKSVQYVNAVEDKGVDLVTQMAMPDDVNGAFVKPYFVRLDLAHGSCVFLERLIGDLDTAPVQGCLVDLGDEFPKALVIFVRPDAHVENRLNFVEIGQGVGREQGQDFVEQGFQSLGENRAVKYLEQVTAQVQGHKFRIREGDGQV